MSTRTRKRIGFTILTLAWAVVLSGAVLAVVSLTGHDANSDEHAGIGFALIMGGMLIVLMGNYIVHRAKVEYADDDV
jgi:hypothetical protein